ncbi:MAG: magnesium transporter CorA family protein, partial [Gammaproteobacteria bacterium]|nr:magnesium transporter CorA family protein [Gammaproteobacteria bacterium]
RQFGVPDELLAHFTDIDERPRVDQSADSVLVVLHYPSPRTNGDDGPPWRMLPLSVILTPRGIVTLAPAPVGFLQAVPAHGDPRRQLATERHVEFVLRICWHVADDCLTALRDINARVDALENQLRRSLRNEEVMGLLAYQKSLTYFATGMKGNELMLERFESLPLVKLAGPDADLLDDVRIEMRQAIAMVDIADNVLSDMMDAFASIVSNNLNAVMKVLTSVTILLAVPTLIVSIYGMNVGLPGAQSPRAFLGLVALSVAISGGLFIVFRRKNWL